MSKKNSVGEQLDTQTLFARQKALREARASFPAPIIVAVNLQTPENIGSVLRLADAAGCASLDRDLRQVYFIEDAQPSLAKIRKTARSADALVKWESLSLGDFLAKHATDLQPLIAVELTTHSTSLFETLLPADCALVVGSERHGIPPALLDICAQAIHVPMYGVNGSMNVTHALAIVLFEWRRQHEGKVIAGYHR